MVRCLVQGARARAALISMEADKGAPLEALSPRTRRVLREQPLQWREAVRSSSAAIRRAINGTMHRCCC